MNRHDDMGNPIGRSPLARELGHLVARSMSLGMETNGIGFHGFIVELPGAFVRGSTLEEAVSKAPNEAKSYLAWLGKEWAQFSKARVVQTHRSGLMVEDADCEILLSVDRHPMSEKEFRSLVKLTKFSGRTFTKLYESTTFRDWIDEARIRITFYGQNQKTIQEIIDHVKRTQYYYLSRAGVHFKQDEANLFCESAILPSMTSRGSSERMETRKSTMWTKRNGLSRKFCDGSYGTTGFTEKQ